MEETEGIYRSDTASRGGQGDRKQKREKKTREEKGKEEEGKEKKKEKGEEKEKGEGKGGNDICVSPKFAIFSVK